MHAVLEGVVRLRRLGLVVAAMAGGMAVGRGGSGGSGGGVAAIACWGVVRGSVVRGSMRGTVVGQGGGEDGPGEEESGGGKDRGLKDARLILSETSQHALIQGIRACASVDPGENRFQTSLYETFCHLLPHPCFI